MNDKFEIPDVIYLQCHDDDGELLDSSDEEITWCEDDIGGHGVKYIREERVRDLLRDITTNKYIREEKVRDFLRDITTNIAGFADEIF